MIEGKKIILRAYKESDIEISFKLINTLNIRTMLGRVYNYISLYGYVNLHE